MSSEQTQISVSVNGSEVTISGLRQPNGTLANGTLTLQVLNPDGTLGTNMFKSATQDQFNKAVLTLDNQAGSDNSAAVQQRQQASQASANASAEQTASNDLATVQGIGFSSDLNNLAGDVTKTGTDLGTVKSDAANGPNGAAECANLEGTVNADVEGSVDAGMEGGFDADLGSLTSGIASARSAIGALQNDLSGLHAAELSAPSGAASAITSAQGAISNAVSTANGDIQKENGLVGQAYQVANGIATGSCSGDGPGSPPNPIPASS